jgi:hypothetical protein
MSKQREEAEQLRRKLADQQSWMEDQKRQLLQKRIDKALGAEDSRAASGEQHSLSVLLPLWTD